MTLFKFQIGDFVEVNHSSDISWKGYIYKRANTGEGIEYGVTNGPIMGGCIPLLAWESEVTEASDDAF